MCRRVGFITTRRDERERDGYTDHFSVASRSSETIGCAERGEKQTDSERKGGKKGILVLFARAGTADKILDPLDEIPEKHPPPFFSIDEKFERFSVNSSSTIMRIINFNVLPF